MVRFIAILSVCLLCCYLPITMQQQMSFTITDLQALERSLRANGVSEPLFQAIYSAAGCSFKANDDINRKLEQLVNSVDKVQIHSVTILQKILSHKQSQTVDTGAAELIIKHVFQPETLADTINPNNEVEELIGQVHPGVAGSRYHPLSAIEKVVAPDICKTMSVTRDLLSQLDSRKEQLLELAKKHYDYPGDRSLSQFAVFYHNYVMRNYADKNRVMGLAKLLGDYMTISSEAFYMDEAMENNAKYCEPKQVRQRRNVDVTRILKGTCARSLSKNMPNIDSKILKNVPFMHSIVNFMINPNCPNQTKYQNKAEELEATEIMMMDYVSLTNACVYSRMCTDSKYYLLKDGSCKLTTKTTSVTNVIDLEVSVVKDRMKIDEIPKELLTLEKKYCSIDSTIVSKSADCDRPATYLHTFIVFQIENKWFITDRSVLVAHGQDVTSICFYDCMNCTNCLMCQGDVTYEASFGSWPTANCSCKYNKEYSDLYVSVGLSRIAVNAVAKVEWEVSVPVSTVRMIACSSCKATCIGNSIKIERDVEFDKLHACIDEQCFIIESEQVDVEYALPTNLFHVSHLEIRFYRSDGQGMHVVNVSCKDQHQCESVECDFCLLRFANPHCYKFVNWLFLITLLSITVMFIPITYFAASLIWMVIKLIFLPIIFLWKLCRVSSKKVFNKTKSKAGTIKKKVDEFCEIELEERVPLNRTDPLKNFSLITIVFMLLFSHAFGCENTIGISSKQMDCETSPTGKINCKINTVVDLILSSLGEESCLSLRDQNNVLVQIIKVKTLGIKQVCLRDIQYYTTDPEFKFINQFRCRSAGRCIDDVCEKSGDNLWVTLPYEDEKKAGIKGCARVTGFWGNGCFFAGQACNFYKAELINHNKISYEVSKCSEWVWEVNVEITIKKDKEETKQERKLSTSIPASSAIGILQLETLSAPSVPILNTCLIKRLTSDSRTAPADCSNRGTRTPGLVGEIQCSTPSMAEQASKGCLLSSLSHTLIPQDDNVVFVNKFVNVSKIWSANVLPKTIGDSVVSEITSGDVMLHYSGLASYNIRVKMNDYEVSFDYSKATCEAHFRSLKGCSNCGAGAKLIVEVILKGADRVPISLKCPSAESEGLDLAIISNTFREFKMSFTKAEILEKCTLTCPGNTVELLVKGTLLNSITISKDSDTAYLGWASDFISSVPWFNFGLTRYLLIGLGVFIVIPIVILLLKSFIALLNFIISLIPRKREHKMQSKYV